MVVTLDQQYNAGEKPSVMMYVYMYGHTYSKSMDQPGKVASPAHGQLNRKNEYFPVRVRAIINK